MSRCLIINTLILLAVTVHARSQYIDFFQSFSTFIQPYTTRKPDVTTKRQTNRQTTKQRYQDAIYFETDEFLKQREHGGSIDPFTTTVKPRRKSKPTTTKPTTRKLTTRPWYQTSNERTTNYNNEPNSYDSNIIINNNRYNENNRKVDNDNNNVNNYNNDAINAARNYNRHTTERLVNNNFNVAQNPTNSRPIHNRHTTINPLLHRPGVRPAAVDDSQPPITNKPVTNRPFYDRPLSSERPVKPSTGSDRTGTQPNIEVGPDEEAMTETEKRRYIEIAEQKCDEYKALNTKKVVALPLASIHATQGVELDVSTCTPINIPLVIGGKIVRIQEFPHMSLVGWKNIQKGGYSWKCGGSLISDQYILTAGHCTFHDKDYNVVSGPPSAVQLGSSYIDGSDSLVISISSIVRHPKYKVRRSYYDVALIKLITTVTFSEKIRPACLGVPPSVGDRIIATGWGRTEFGGDSSQDLRSVSIPIWDMGSCREVWGTSRKLPEGPSPSSQLCAGERAGGKDTCQGDSGGPAQIQDGCAWRVVAVTSIGRSCGAAETPALYAKLPRAFIASQVFANVKLSQNRHNNSNNGNNNWSYQGVINQNNGFNNQGVPNNQNFGNNRDEFKRPGNHQTIGNNNWGVTDSNNQFGNSQNLGSNRDLNRPGNHQTIVSNRPVTDNQFVNNQNIGNRDDVYRPGNHQTVDSNNRRDVSEGNYYGSSQTSGTNRDGIINRPGNHQTIDNNNRGNVAVSNYFVTSHTSGNNRGAAVIRPGNHQTIDTSNRNSNTGNNFFVTSHTSGNNRARVVSRPGNHQTIGNNKNHDTVQNNKQFSDSINSESNQDVVYDARSESNNNAQNYNNYNSRDNVRNTWATNNARHETDSNQYNNERNGYYNEQVIRNQQNSRTTKTYSDFGSQNSDYGTTENIYNSNNNGYNVNNNREFVVANRPWWKR